MVGWQFVLATVGKPPKNHDYLDAGWAMYYKRLAHRCNISLVEVPEAAIRPSRTSAQVKEEEAQRLFPLMATAQCVVALHETGQRYTSPAFAAALGKRLEGLSGQNTSARGGGSSGSTGMLWIVGGPLGLASSVLDKADWVVSLSDMTLPHPMVRLLWIEQIYRAFRLLNNEPYHK
jgi:23S rRNA (pseudouridine1915-N3)-methyltransferase